MSLLAMNFCEIFCIQGMWLAIASMVIIHHITVIGDLFFSEKMWI